MLADQFDVFFFDLDGVVYVGNRPLPHTLEVLSRLRTLGKQLRFLTNDPSPSRERVVTRLQGMGIEAYKEEVITSGWATALYLTRQQLCSAYVVGSGGLREELENVGIHIMHKEEDQPEAVVIGCDDAVSYRDIRHATRLIHRGAEFIATSPDLWFPTPHGPLPGVGTIVEAIRLSCDKQPFIVGKPSPTMFQEALLSCGVSQRVIMVGDTPGTDILGAHQAGLPAVLVARDAPASSPLPHSRDLQAPEAVIPDLSGLFNATLSISYAVSYLQV